MLLPKAKKPDFLVATVWGYVECKQGGETWSINDITDVQAEVLTENDRTSNSWIFLELGEGIAPDGRGAWLIPWAFLQGYQAAAKVRSVRFEVKDKSRAPLARDIFFGYELVWNKGKWTIPASHVWWEVYGRDIQLEEPQLNDNLTTFYENFEDLNL
jgi:hypothetical protein